MNNALPSVSHTLTIRGLADWRVFAAAALGDHVAPKSGTTALALLALGSAGVLAWRRRKNAECGVRKAEVQKGAEALQEPPFAGRRGRCARRRSPCG